MNEKILAAGTYEDTIEIVNRTAKLPLIEKALVLGYIKGLADAGKIKPCDDVGAA